MVRLSAFPLLRDTLLTMPAPMSKLPDLAR